MVDLGAASKLDFIGNDFPVNERAAGIADGAIVRHEDTTQSRLTIHGDGAAAAANIEQDIVPGHATRKNDFRVIGERELLRDVNDKVCRGRPLKSKCPAADDKVLELQHDRLSGRAGNCDVVVSREVNVRERGVRESDWQRKSRVRSVRGFNDAVIQLGVGSGVMMNDAGNVSVTVGI